MTKIPNHNDHTATGILKSETGENGGICAIPNIKLMEFGKNHVSHATK
jgi:hypothetical protein